MKYLSALAVAVVLAITPHHAPKVSDKEIPATTTTVAPTTTTTAPPNPMAFLPAQSREVFTCIMWIESRSTPNNLKLTDYNPSSGAGGVFQFLPWIWQWAAAQLGIDVEYANQATAIQQFRVAAFYYNRNSGFAPEWQDPACT